MTIRIETSPQDQLLREQCHRRDEFSESRSVDEGHLTLAKDPIITLVEFVII